MNRTWARILGLSAYGLALGSLVWFVAWLHDWGLERTLERGPEADVATALIVDLALLLVFGFQHSVMARPGFKAALAERVPATVERSVYVLAATLTVIAIFVAWHPIPIVWFDLRGTAVAPVLTGLSLLGYLGMIAATFAIDHRDLFGLKQIEAYVEGRRYDPPELVESSVYAAIRHPIYAGWILFFWATPYMTAGHALFAAFMTAYVLVAIPLEEKDLSATLGAAYRRYRDRVPRFVPSWRRQGPGRSTTGRRVS